MKKILLASVAAAGLVFGATGAQAGLVINGGSSGTIVGTPGGNNDALPGLGLASPMSGWLGATIAIDEAGDVTYTYLGREAGWNNKLVTPGGTLDGNLAGGSNNWNSAGFGSVSVTGLSAGNLVFSLVTPVGSVANGSNPMPGTPAAPTVNFFTAWDPDNAGSLLVFLDDTGGANNKSDDNHDDYVFRISFTPADVPVPEPASLALFGAGLLGLGLVRRRKAH